MNAEKLFDMDFTDYASFLQAKKEFDGIIKILRLYEKQKVAIASWATTIWNNLKPNLLLEAIEDIMQDFRQLQEWVRGCAFQCIRICKIDISICFDFPRTDSTASCRPNTVHGYVTIQDCSAIDGQFEE